MGRPRDEPPPRRREKHRDPPGPPRTLADVQKNVWMWASCTNHDCSRSVPIVFAPYVIRYGPLFPFEEFKQRLTCARCGKRRAYVTGRSWGGSNVGFMPWPAEHYEVGPDGIVNRRNPRRPEP